VTAYETERLVVREWRDDPEEIDRAFDTYSRWEVARWLGANPRAMADRSEAAGMVRRFRERNTAAGAPYGIWAVEVRDTGVVAGTVLLLRLPNSDGSPPSEVEVGWHFHPDSWGQGYATEAARGALRRGFDAGLPRVYAVVHAGNERSVAVTRRLGMSPLGLTDRWYGISLEAYVVDAPTP
jgi:RimJ/RimL family protein N-acetyltransferase